MSVYFFSGFDYVRETLAMPIRVSTSVGDSLVVDRVYQSYVVTFVKHKTLVDLLVLDMVDFDVILDMDCLAPYHFVLDCFARTVTLALVGVTRITWKGYT